MFVSYENKIRELNSNNTKIIILIITLIHLLLCIYYRKDNKCTYDVEWASGNGIAS